MGHLDIKAAISTLCLTIGLLFLLPTSLLAQSQSAQNRVMFVFDASNSMWGQVGGKPKIQIAREAMVNALSSLKNDGEAGLMIYGHRKRGSCSDIQLVVPMQSVASARGSITNVINRVKPKGKTPLTEAVRQAADAMKYQEVPSTVVLVTDGVESCSADPCALGNELEKFGVDFTAHVVGFGLSRGDAAKVSCLAENTGGQYIQADNGKALQEALNTVVTTNVAPPTPSKPVLPNLVHIRTVMMDDKDRGARVEAKGKVGIKRARGTILDPAGNPVADAETTLKIPDELAKRHGLKANDRWTIQFSPKVEGEYAFQIEYSGVTQNLPFSVSAGMDPLVVIKPWLTYTKIEWAQDNGKIMGTGLVRAWYCPPNTTEPSKEVCIYRTRAETYLPSGDYRLFLKRRYKPSIKADLLVTIDRPRQIQIIKTKTGDTVQMATAPKAEQSTKQPEATEQAQSQVTDGANGDMQGYRALYSFNACSSSPIIAQLMVHGDPQKTAMLRLEGGWCGKGSDVCAASTNPVSRNALLQLVSAGKMPLTLAQKTDRVLFKFNDLRDGATVQLVRRKVTGAGIYAPVPMQLVGAAKSSVCKP